MARAILLLGLLGVPSQSRADEIQFDRDIAPLLARRCLECHSGPAPKGDLDLTGEKSTREVLADKLDEATLWQRVRDDEMPPKKPLSDSEKSLLKRWIASGAKWGTDPIDPFRLTTEHRAGYDWWSLQPVVRRTPPTVRHAALARTAIDAFLLARLEAKGLTFSPPADRRTLLRRVTFDLTGLPPTPEEVEEFVHDARPDAYERVVDRLLASPAYGERMARFWLDIVRYGESDGFERDLPRFQAWPYRDWIVQAFNADLPYDEFVRMQLAGDVLGGTEGLPATGFLVAGPHDIVLPVSETMRAAMRQDELEDLVGTVGQTFLGLTVHCARCHDHKFDPIPQRDYYRLVAALSGVTHGERSFSSEETQRQLASAKKQAEALRGQLVELEEPTRRQLTAEKLKQGIVGPEPLAAWELTRSLNDTRGLLHLRLKGGAKRTDQGLLVDGRSAYAISEPLAVTLTEKTLEAWVRLANLEQRGGGVLSVQTLDGNRFDAIVFGEQQPGHWLAGSEFFYRTRALEGSPEQSRGLVHFALTYAADGTITAYRDGKPYGKSYKSESFAFHAGKSQVVLGMRHGPPGGNKMLAGTIAQARLYARALSAEEIALSFGQPIIHSDEVIPRLPGPAREKHQRLSEQLDRLTRDISRLQREVDRRIYAVNSQPIGPTHLLLRGEVTAKGEQVSPGPLVALASRVLASTTGADDGSRRLALARWITDPKNPLFARVMVNRLWQMHFGLGLVETPSDLGFNGGRPSHPELLDWLAEELVRQNWRLKTLHRQMILSTAYRQSSARNEVALRLDADNRLLWRKSPTRLEAEAVRDAVLVATGRLDRTMGGPPYLDFKTYFFKGTQFYEALPEVGPAFERRSLYRMWARGGRNPLLDTLDCPDPSATTPRRAVTTTPLQALALWNNAFILEQAEQLAKRLRHETNDPEEQLRLAVCRTLSRDPRPEELDLLRRFRQRHGLAALGRVLFNTNEFIQLD